MIDQLTGYSRAMYSSWLWHRPLGLVIDAGEGLALALVSRVFTPSTVAVTHGHSDHVLGLPGFAAARRFGKGASARRWTVVYPEGSDGVASVRRTLDEIWRGVTFPIEWVPVGDGSRHPLGKGRVLEAFAVTHVPPEPALGYRVLEHRRRLTPEHAARPPEEIERDARAHGREELTEEFEHVVFAHSGDAMPLDPGLVARADLLVHDATFLSADERREPIHSTSGEALAVAREAGVRALVLNHLSVRYDRASALPRLRDQVAASGFTGGCWLLDEDRFVDLRR